MLIKMIDGGLVDYTDDSWHIAGCPTCDYGALDITEVELTLTKYKVQIEVETESAYCSAFTVSDMMKIFLSNYAEIITLTEIEFISWFEVVLETRNCKLRKYEVSEI